MSKKNLHASAVDTIAEWIVSSRYPAGDVLPIEADLCEALGVSRTVVREAVKTLAAKGMVAVAPKLGSRVLDEHSWHLFDPQVLRWRLAFRDARDVAEDLVELRLLLEPAAAGLAAQRATHSQRRDIRRAFETMEATAGEPEAYSLADMGFHGAILLACHNSFLTRLVPLIEVLISTTLELYADKGWNSAHIKRAALPLHARVMRAIESGDGVAAETASKAIISRAYEDMARAPAPSRRADRSSHKVD
ncbi:MAG: FadR family transcriptional regulator [Burkholderiaceae bacterium]|nr:FadR family transcriptional regulator [Burkholderiaceae bacterium]